MRNLHFFSDALHLLQLLARSVQFGLLLLQAAPGAAKFGQVGGSLQVIVLLLQAFPRVQHSLASLDGDLRPQLKLEGEARGKLLEHQRSKRLLRQDAQGKAQRQLQLVLERAESLGVMIQGLVGAPEADDFATQAVGMALQLAIVRVVEALQLRPQLHVLLRALRMLLVQGFELRRSVLEAPSELVDVKGHLVDPGLALHIGDDGGPILDATSS
eukprot:scaffold803_cov310-Pinguiococcus_pyrenoidosus.AAC.42